MAAEIVAAAGCRRARLKDPQSPMIATITQYLVPFLLVLSVVVFVHEFGHYYVARRNGVRIEVFSIGFGPELFGRNDRHGTRWKFSAIPLGGYVKMLGDADAASASVDPRHARSPTAFPPRVSGSGWRSSSPGPMSNFIFAIVALAILFAVVGRPFTPPEVGTVQPDSPAAAAGLLPGDRITAVDGQPIASFEDLQAVVRDNAGQPLTFALVARRRDRWTGHGHPGRPARSTDRFGNVHQVGLIGVSRAGVEYRRSNPFLALFEATAETGKMIGGTLYALGRDGGRHARHAGAGRAAADRPDVGRRSRRTGSCRRCGSRPSCPSISA